MYKLKTGVANKWKICHSNRFHWDVRQTETDCTNWAIVKFVPMLFGCHWKIMHNKCQHVWITPQHTTPPAQLGPVPSNQHLIRIGNVRAIFLWVSLFSLFSHFAHHLFCLFFSLNKIQLSLHQHFTAFVSRNPSGKNEGKKMSLVEKVKKKMNSVYSKQIDEEEEKLLRIC